MKDRTNTIAGWVLAAGIVALGGTIVTGEIYKHEKPEKFGFAIEGGDEDAAGGAAPVEQPIAVYLASADPAKGADVFKKCAACHNADKGGANAIGPNLYGVVGDAIAAGRGGYAFSDALKGAAKGGSWTWDNLSTWLKSPKGFAPGTKMTFAGLSSPQDRANVMAWLNTQSDHPVALPAAPPAGAPSDAKAAAENKDLGQGVAKAKNQPVQSEGQAAKQPAGNIAGDGAPSVNGRADQEHK